jgi:dynein heavy chain
VLTTTSLTSTVHLGVCSGEAQLEDSLQAVAQGWSDIEFITINHRDQATVFILGGLDLVFMQLEDNQVTLQTMMGSRFILGVQSEVEEWEKKLSLLSDTLDEWTACQKQWMYLETIFSAEDIQKQLPVEAQKFKMVDKFWCDTLIRANEIPNVIRCLDEGLNLHEGFQNCNETLDQIQKSLEEYLETKRMTFPRFFFLSNDELLEILSQTRDPHAVQPHMVKCFDAIKSVRFDTTAGKENQIQGMNDPKGEYVNFSEPVVAQGAVEHWLCDVEDQMRASLYAQAKKSYECYPPVEEARDRSGWLFGQAAAITIVIDEIFWTRGCNEAIIKVQDGEGEEAKNGVKDFCQYTIEQIDNMVEMVRGELTKNQRTMMGALLTIDVHARDVLRGMVKKETASIRDFQWTRQLRYYWEQDNVWCAQTNFWFKYGYEFLGNTPRLVITPLTDLCYMTLTGAIQLKFGGAPAGPAGTGKTETTKDLAKALALLCVVFNCSDGLDYKIMGRFFKGLAMAGAWACFDEFNRIGVEVLSVIAQQVMSIQHAIKMGWDEFDFEGTIITCNPNFGVFITMNPGYAGRTELPDNLQALFRPVAMMVPDYRMIAEIVLFSEGFANALPLSNKMSQLYALASEQLSKQDHYDFGMRAVKSVLVAAGQLKRKEPDTFEDLLLIRAMRDSNVPKFLEADLPLFAGILQDLFPGVVVPFVDYGLLQKAIENQIRKANLQVVESFVTKVIQVHQTQLVRHGMMVVGDAAAGKSRNIRILAAALQQLQADGITDVDSFYKKVDMMVLNPKSITAGQLYGQFNMMTGEWFDGLVPKMFRDCVAASVDSDDRKWITFDGPVDAVWIENMNTVLDDNKMLCLANSERIKMADTMHMMFEVMDLKVASPATVSRCGMVFMEQVHVGADSLLASWANAEVKDILPEAVPIVVELLTTYFDKALEFMHEFCSEKVYTSMMQQMSSCINLVWSMIREHETKLKKQAAAGEGGIFDLLMRKIVVFSLSWSIGGNVEDSKRAVFNEYMLEKVATPIFDPIPHGLEDVYGVTIDINTGAWAPWSELMLANYEFDPNRAYFDILVPTVDTTKYSSLLSTLLHNRCHTLFMAETGVGKSVVIQGMLKLEQEAGKFVSIQMSYSAQTRPDNLKEILETKWEKKRKTLLGPPAGKGALFFIDDVNMPALEEYGAQPPNELLRQLIDGGGFYDTGKLFFKAVADTTVVSACAPPGGGRNEISPRLQRHFNMVWLPQLSEESMKIIFTAILGGFLGHYIPHLKSVAAPVVASSVDIYKCVEQQVLPTPAKSHYTFNLRDLSKVFQGVLMVTAGNCPDKDELLKLWLHEECRVFRDRLINADDRDLFNKLCSECTAKQMNEPMPIESFSDLLFGDYLTREDKQYKEVDDVHKLTTLLEEYLEEYNISFPTQMHLVFFHDAVHHVSRIARVLRQPRGNALLVGVGGSGRQSLTRLGAFMADQKVFQIEITRGYGSTEFHEDLKNVLMTAGAENKRVVFLFSDSQIVEEGFLEDINNVLNTGEVPNLYAHEDIEKIVGLVRPLAIAAGKGERRDIILSHFTHLVRENLHVVLAFSPIGAGFRTRCRMFPSLVNCCTIDWFNAWPAEALRSVALYFLDEAKEELAIDAYIDQLCSMAVIIHRSVEEATERFWDKLKRRNYTTPTSYLELLKLYTELLKKQRNEVSTKESRYKGGLQKLAETESIVSSLQGELKELQPKLVIAGRETDALIIQVNKDKAEANIQSEIVGKDVAEANKAAAEVGEQKSSVQADLDEALPAYHQSIAALDKLDKKSIQELKSFANPPRMVGVTMDAVCLLFGKKQNWKEAKGLLGQVIPRVH